MAALLLQEDADLAHGGQRLFMVEPQVSYFVPRVSSSECHQLLVRLGRSGTPCMVGDLVLRRASALDLAVLATIMGRHCSFVHVKAARFFADLAVGRAPSGGRSTDPAGEVRGRRGGSRLLLS